MTTKHSLTSLDKDGLMPKHEKIRPNATWLTTTQRGYNECKNQVMKLGVEFNIEELAKIIQSFDYRSDIHADDFIGKAKAISQNPSILKLVVMP